MSGYAGIVIGVWDVKSWASRPGSTTASGSSRGERATDATLFFVGRDYAAV